MRAESKGDGEKQRERERERERDNAGWLPKGDYASTAILTLSKMSLIF